jgi:hypothetical protein
MEVDQSTLAHLAPLFDLSERRQLGRVALEDGTDVVGAADRSAMAAFFNFVLLGIHAPDGHGMPHTQNYGQAQA